MTDRTPHYLRAGKPVGFPRLSIAVGASYRAKVREGPQREAIYDLSAWSAVAWGRSVGAPGTVVTKSGTNPLEFWAWLDHWSREQGTVWVWTLGACSFLTAMRFWGLLDAGMWNPDGFDPAAQQPLESQRDALRNWTCVLSDPPTIVLARQLGHKSSTRFVDVRNLGVQSYDGMWADVRQGLSVGWHPPGPLDSPQTVAAWRADVLARWLIDWYDTVRELRLGGIRATSGAQAWHGWLASYNRSAILVHTDRTALACERSALFAGRAEAFRIGRTDCRIVAVDAAAMYPAVSLGTDVPCRFAEYRNCDTVAAHKAATDGFCVIAQGIVRTEVPLVPRRAGDIVIWPVGEWRATLCWPEVSLLLSRGQQFECERVWLYEPGRPFDAYASALWTAREQAARDGQWGKRSAIKRLLNCLFGKFAQTGWQWQSTGEIDHETRFGCWYQADYDSCNGGCGEGAQGAVSQLALPMDSGTVQLWRSIAGHIQRQCRSGETGDSCPAITAWIYSLARVRLWEWIECAGRENVYYVDTDSLWVNEKGFSALCAADMVGKGELGKLKLEGVHDWALFHGVKYYETPTQFVCAGWSDTHNVTTEGGFVFWRPETPQESLKRQQAPKATLRGRSAPMPRPYRHGLVMADGRVLPWRIQDDGLDRSGE